MEKILFGVIGVLLFSISSIGVYEAVLHPAETVALVPEAVSTVTEALNDATESVAHTVSAVVVSAPASHEVTDDESTQASASNSRTVPSRDSDDDKDEEGDEDGEDDDRVSNSTSPDSAVSKPASVSTAAPAPGATPAAATTFNMAQVATHNSATSCYSAINGSVYDLTSFIRQHPGGQSAIKSLCGVDGTAAYSGQHGGQNRPANELAPLMIGVLAS